MPGRLIVVDGVEGGGKTTQLAFIRACLERAGHPVIATREPGGTALGEE
ncbi:MAG: dTMP kinase, partial [Candidatus Competibacter sp.]|nr:dTMP kinase [Candidatus Competibacter sp.]